MENGKFGEVLMNETDIIIEMVNLYDKQIDLINFTEYVWFSIVGILILLLFTNLFFQYHIWKKSICKKNNSEKF